MRIIIRIMVIFFLFTACKNDTKVEVVNPLGVHKIVVQDVVQVSEYTYLLVKDEGIERWIAAPSVQVEKGKTYYYKNGMEMTNFESKELNKTFDKIYFVSKLSTDPNMSTATEAAVVPKKKNLTHQAAKPKLEKLKVEIPKEKGIITIAELYKNPEKYEGKKVKVKGKVTKYNPAILKKNWIHLQDGSAFKDKFDLTATINNEVKVGDLVTLEGVISVNKDFGYGYVYELIMENTDLVSTKKLQ